MNFNKETFVEVNEKPEAKMFEVSQNYPNPATGMTQLMVSLNVPSPLTLSVRNLPGQEVQSMDLGNMPAGKHLVRIDLSGMKPGIYFFTVKTGSGEITRKMMVG